MSTNLKDRVAQQGAAMQAGLATVKAGQPTNVQTLLRDDSFRREMTRLLFDEAMAERWLRVALTEARKNPKLLSCTWESFAGALLQCAQNKLEPGTGQAWIVPYKNRRTGKFEAQFQLGYQGVIQLAMRSGQLASIAAREVCENDEFDHDLATDYLRHVKKLDGDRGSSYAYYGRAKFANGGVYVHVMSKAEVEGHRNRFSKAADDGPWKEHFDAMARKTVIKQMKPYLPQSADWADFSRAVDTEEQRAVWRPGRGLQIGDDAGEEFALPAHEEQEPQVDAETGEIREGEGGGTLPLDS